MLGRTKRLKIGFDTGICERLQSPKNGAPRCFIYVTTTGDVNVSHNLIFKTPKEIMQTFGEISIYSDIILDKMIDIPILQIERNKETNE